MTNWAYVATPYGAPLYQTLKLARGQITPKDREKLFDNCGIIFRKIYNSKGEPIEIVKELKPGDNLLLMYNFAHTGVIYPIQQFKIMDPNVAKYRIKFPIQKEGGYGAIGKIEVDSFVQINFIPDYLDPEDVENSNLQHVICIEPHSEWLPKDKVGKVVLNAKQHDLAIKDVDKLEFVDEKDSAKILEDVYNDYAKDRTFEHVLFGEHKAFWKLYNGWIKMMLYENKLLETSKPRPKAENEAKINSRFINHAFETLPLCAIFEYVLNMLLKKEANALILSTGRPIMDGVELSVFPESTLEGLECWDRMNLICRLVEQNKIMTAPASYMAFKNLLHNLRKFRNRIAHSYFIEQRHYETMKQCIHDLLKIYCLNA